jgi:guanine deaminase
MNDRSYLEEAIRLANENANLGFGPFGAIIVKQENIIAGMANRVVNDMDPTAHAEVMVIREASKLMNTIDLSGCTLYSSAEPCPMCMGAIYWARIDRVVYANTLKDSLGAGFEDDWMYTELSLPNNKRKVIMEHMPMDEAKKALEAWLNNPDRLNYHIHTKYTDEGKK